VSSTKKTGLLTGPDRAEPYRSYAPQTKDETLRLSRYGVQGLPTTLLGTGWQWLRIGPRSQRQGCELPTAFVNVDLAAQFQALVRYRIAE
jgi:hypothetical protein